MSDASFALQKAVVTALVADAPLMAIVTGVHDDVPEGAAYPYIEINDITATENGATLMEGLEHQIEIKVWSRYRGAREVFDVMERADAALHKATLDLTADGHRLVNIMRTARRTLRDIEPEIRQGILEYRAVTEEI